MNIIEIIEDKKVGKELSREQLEFWIEGLMNGEIADYQTSALLMAIVLKGMTDKEAVWLTNAMANSGDKLDLSAYGDLSADKHSSGGVGDSTTFIVLPTVVACGLVGAKMSGRGLGHTGGTLDKLEAIEGLSVSMSPEKFYNQVNKIGIAVAGQTGQICPADKKLYALRDVTATVDSVALIASSIMSKKLAGGAKNIVLDVKCGKGAFMKNQEDAVKLAKLMVAIGKASGRNISALVTDMNVPLSNYVGNSLEVYGALKVLKNECRGRLYEASMALAERLLESAGIDNAKERAEEAVSSGRACRVFESMIAEQGGDIEYLKNPEKLLNTRYVSEILAESDGFVNDIDAMKIAEVVRDMGGGRLKVEDKIDPWVGVEMTVNVGDKVAKGDTVAKIYYNHIGHENLKEKVQSAVAIDSQKPKQNKLILEIIK
ncbi:MAG: thymidine phosphorylase [Eubacteriales bacterium]|nr:thymidine phosphorylase [Eubacteriales bacterium]